MPWSKDAPPEGVVVRSFASDDLAGRAVEALTQAGFTSEDISVVARERDRAEQIGGDAAKDVATGVGVGAVAGTAFGVWGAAFLGATALAIPGIGLVAGPLALILGGAGIGAATGGLAQWLGQWGIPDEEARGYHDRLEAGDILVMVAAGSRATEARRILETVGAPGAADGPTVQRPLNEPGTSSTSRP